MRVVIDTNLWIRALLLGARTLPILEAWYQGKFEVVCSQELISELQRVCKRPRLRSRMLAENVNALFEQLQEHAVFVILKTTPPNCRDPQDHPVLATAIDGKADAIVTGDADLRADDILRQGMKEYGIELWGIQTFLEKLNQA